MSVPIGLGPIITHMIISSVPLKTALAVTTFLKSSAAQNLVFFKSKKWEVFLTKFTRNVHNFILSIS